jgi:hypothetical protein
MLASANAKASACAKASTYNEASAFAKAFHLRQGYGGQDGGQEGGRGKVGLCFYVCANFNPQPIFFARQTLAW